MPGVYALGFNDYNAKHCGIILFGEVEPRDFLVQLIVDELHNDYRLSGCGISYGESHLYEKEKKLDVLLREDTREYLNCFRKEFIYAKEERKAYV